MAQIAYRGNLSAKSFPFLSQNFGQTVIVPGPDQSYSRTSFSPEDLDKDKGIPQIYYCHNVMPHQEGLQSVGYKDVLPATGATGFYKIFLARNDADQKVFVGVRDIGSANELWVSDGTGAPWVYKTFVDPGLITYAYIAGVTYIYVENSGCIEYNFLTGAFVLVPLIGINTDLVVGICAANGYMIAWTEGVPSSNATTGTYVLGDVHIEVATVAGLLAGCSVTGTNVPAGTIITAVYTTGTPAIDISNPVTGGGTATVWAIGSAPSAVAWSSTLNPVDFVPSAETGAGGGAVEQAKGGINYCIPHTLGFIIGTADNCVAALFQNNVLFPFQFRELVNSGGMTSLDLVSYDANSSGLYAYTTSGLQQINTQQTQTLHTEITDFVSGSNFEDFDDLTKQFTETELTTPMVKRLTVVADRYLVFSYGITTLTHALVLDLITKRYGKLKVNHTQCFTYQLAAPSSILETPRQSFAFLQTDGKVVRVDFDIASQYSNGTLLLGKYQYVRSRTLILDGITFESVRTNQTFNLTIMTALDGKNTVNRVPYLASANGQQRTYNSRAEGINHSLLLQGGFMANTLKLDFHIGSAR